MWSSAANGFVRILLAPDCASCRAALERPLDGPVCVTCWRAIPRLTAPWCDWCGDTLPAAHGPYDLCDRCLARPPAFDVARSAGLYDGTLRTLIHRFKYEGRRLLAPPLAQLMATTGRQVLAGADAVVPVPLHPIRGLTRGFNQADDLARHLGLPVWRLLRRVQYGPPQAGLPAHRRAGNVHAAFGPALRLTIGRYGLPTPQLRNATVVLIDDVMTTGATLDACSRALVEAGAKSVRALTVARAATPRPAPPPPRPRPSTPPRR